MVNAHPPVGGWPPEGVNPVKRLSRLVATLALIGSLLVPTAILAVDPSPSPVPSPSPSTAPAAPVPDSELPVPDTDLLESIPVTITGGQFGASLSPAALIFTDIDTKGGIVRISNPSDQLLTVSVRVRDYTIDASGTVTVDENGEPTVGIPNYQYASAAWYTFQYTDFLLPAGRRLNLPFVISAPLSAAPGDHIAALVVLARRARLTDEETGGISVSARTGFRFLLRLQHRIAGAESATPTVAVTAAVDGSRRIDFIATVNNEGTTVLDYKPYVEGDPTPFFRVTAKNSGELIRIFDLPKGFYVLPEGNRVLSISWRAEDLTEPTGSAAEVARLKADETTAQDREQLSLIRAKRELAEARLAYNNALTKLEVATADAVGSLRAQLLDWYTTEQADREEEVSPAVLAAKLTDLITATSGASKLPVSTLAPLAALAGSEVAATVALRRYADTVALPYTGDYTVEFVLPKRGDQEELVLSADFSFVNADPAKTLADSAPIALILVAVAAALLGLGGIAFLRRRNRGEDEVSAE
jgi:hypothetical protein